MTDPDREIYGPHAIKLGRPTRVFGSVAAIAAVLAAGFSLRGNLNDAGQARSDRLRGCQSTIAVQLVSAPQARALKALADYGFEDGRFKDAAARLQPAEYERLTKLALSNPTAFLAECDTIARTGTSLPKYRTCAEARAAGDAPLQRGDPGYSSDLDANHDGIACE